MSEVGGVMPASLPPICRDCEETGRGRVLATRMAVAGKRITYQEVIA